MQRDRIIDLSPNPALRQKTPQLVSPMNSNYSDNQQLTSADISALQALYGVRAPDPHEGSSGNNTVSSATDLPAPTVYWSVPKTASG